MKSPLISCLRIIFSCYVDLKCLQFQGLKNQLILYEIRNLQLNQYESIFATKLS